MVANYIPRPEARKMAALTMGALTIFGLKPARRLLTSISLPRSGQMNASIREKPGKRFTEPQCWPSTLGNRKLRFHSIQRPPKVPRRNGSDHRIRCKRCRLPHLGRPGKCIHSNPGRRSPHGRESSIRVPRPKVYRGHLVWVGGVEPPICTLMYRLGRC